MKIFIDTANIDEIKRAVAWGVVDGVTTNPTLVAREKRNFKELVETYYPYCQRAHQRRSDKHRNRWHGKRSH